MSSNDLRIQILLNAVDKATAPFKSLSKQVQQASQKIKASQDALKELNKTTKQIEGFKKLQSELSQTANKMQSAREKVRELRQQMQQTSQPTDAMRRALEQAQQAAAKLRNKHSELTQEQKKASNALRDLGVNTNRLSDHERELQQRINRTTSELEQQRKAAERLAQQQERLSRAKSTYDRTMEVRNQLAGTGAGMVATGVSTGYMLAKPIAAFSELEDAATQLKVSMMGSDGSVLSEFEDINKLAVKLGDKLPGTTADFQNMMTMLRRQGMSASVILGGLGEATAFLAVQLKMPTEAAAEFAAKMQDATRTSENDMMELMDVIQKGFYLGVDSNNMLNGFTKVSAAMDILKIKGLEGAKAFAPFLIMADQAGMQGEAAGNAYRKVIQRSMSADSVYDANQVLKAQKYKIKLDFTDGKGEFAGIDNLFKQLEQLKGLNTETRLDVMKEIWGDDAETLQVLTLLIEKGKAGYLEVQEKMEKQADLQTRVNLQLGTLKNLWEAAGGTFTNTLANFAETVSDDLKQVTEWLGEVSEKTSVWIKQNPVLASWLFKIIAGFAALAVAGGALSLTLAAILGPMAILRFTLSTLGIRLLPNIGLFSLLKNSVKGFGNSIIWLSKSPLKMGRGAIGAFKGTLNILSNPMMIIRGAISHLGSTLLWLVKSPLAMARIGVQALMIGFGLLTSPITIGIAAIIAIAAAVYKYWEPIKAFINGVIEGFKAGVKPLADLFSPLKPVFDWVIEKVKAIWQWFTDLLKPIESTKESLDSAANMGKKFGEFLADGINIVLAPLKTLTDGVMWLLEKLGVVESKSKKLEEVKIPVHEQMQNAQQATSYAAVSGGAGYVQATSNIPSYAAMSNYTREHDTGGYIPRGKFGIVGENGPEFVNGPANITSRIKTAQAATLAAGLATMSFADAPIHRYAKPAPSYHEQNSSQMQVNANITINAAPGQNAEQIAQEVKRQLERQMRTAKRQNLSSYRDS